MLLVMDFWDIIVIVAGSAGLIYICGCFWQWVMRPIERDWLLSKGSFILRLVVFVSSIPLAVTALLRFMFWDCWETRLLEIAPEKIDNIFETVLFQFLDPGYQGFFNGRAVSSIVAVLGVFFMNGLLISMLTSWFDKRQSKWENGKIRYALENFKTRCCPSFQKKTFAVVIGANEIASFVIKNLLDKKCEKNLNRKSEKNNDYVILQTSRDPQTVREELGSRLSDLQLKKVIIYRAFRDSEEELKHLFLNDCTEIYVLGESTLDDGFSMNENGESFHDALNMRCTDLIAGIIAGENERRKKENKPQSGRRVCKVMFEYQTTYSILQFSDVTKKIKESLAFVPFNRYDSWARKIVMGTGKDGNEEIAYTPLDGEGIMRNSDEHVHLVIVGMSKMGVSLGIQAMLQSHYLNFAQAQADGDIDSQNRRRTRISFIDTNADLERDFFAGRYENLLGLAKHRFIDTGLMDPLSPSIDSLGWCDPMSSGNPKWKHLSDDGGNFLDIEVEFIKGSLESVGVRNYLNHISDDADSWAKNSKLTIAVCLPKAHKAIAAALYMPSSVYAKAQEIWVYQRESKDIILNLAQSSLKSERYEKLRPFGMLYGEYIPDRTQYLRALLVNGAYVFEKIPNLDMSDSTTFETLKEKWRELTMDQKFSNRYFADSISLKLRCIDVDSNDASVNREKEPSTEDLLAIAEHNRWNIQQLIFGYFPADKETDEQFRKLNSNLLVEPEPSALIFKQKKKALKEGKIRIHPNICEYKHLSLVDSEAKKYDRKLNEIIPRIIELVDKHLN